MEAKTTSLTELLQKEEARERKEDSGYFTKFMDYPYDDWKPVRQRYDFVNTYAKGDSVLDVACGFYPVTSELEMSLKVGIDVSDLAKRKAWKELDAFYCLDFTQAESGFLQETLGKYDTVVASEFLEHLDRPGDAIQKMADLMHEDGRMLITVPSGNSIAGLVDKTLNFVKGGGFTYDRFKMFHRTHVSCLKIEEWNALFSDAGLRVTHFDYRPSEIIEGFPKETTPGWKALTSIAPNYLGHQYFFVAEKI